MSMHTFKTKMVKQAKQFGKQFERAGHEPKPAKPAAAPIVSKAEKVFRKAQEVYDTAGRKFHQDATPDLKASRAHLAKAQATFNKAYRAHEKAGG